ncbi:MAG: hypothetical protein ACOYYS_09450 [Chloroflexota bacterium]
MMSYLTPFYLILQDMHERPYRALTLCDEPGIPDDSYVLEEWYCPNSLCPCNEAHLKVFARQQKTYAADIRLPLDPQQPIAPILDNDDDDTFPVYTAKLFRLIADYLKNNPDDVERLRQHYHQLRAVAADPTHPCYKTVDYWGKHGYRQKTSSGHKRHKRR